MRYFNRTCTTSVFCMPLSSRLSENVSAICGKLQRKMCSKTNVHLIIIIRNFCRKQLASLRRRRNEPQSEYNKRNYAEGKNNLKKRTRKMWSSPYVANDINALRDNKQWSISGSLPMAIKVNSRIFRKVSLLLLSFSYGRLFTEPINCVKNWKLPFDKERNRELLRFFYLRCVTTLSKIVTHYIQRKRGHSLMKMFGTFVKFV